jgi:hypothetical protein
MSNDNLSFIELRAVTEMALYIEWNHPEIKKELIRDGYVRGGIGIADAIRSLFNSINHHDIGLAGFLNAAFADVFNTFDSYRYGYALRSLFLSDTIISATAVTWESTLKLLDYRISNQEKNIENLKKQIEDTEYKLSVLDTARRKFAARQHELAQDSPETYVYVLEFSTGRAKSWVTGVFSSFDDAKNVASASLLSNNHDLQFEEDKYIRNAWIDEWSFHEEGLTFNYWARISKRILDKGV